MAKAWLKLEYHDFEINIQSNLSVAEESLVFSLLSVPSQRPGEISGGDPEGVVCQPQAGDSAGAGGEGHSSEKAGRNTYGAEK